MTTGADVLKLIEEKGIKYVDLRFTDTKGKEQHVTVPTRIVDEAFFEDGKGFDGSSIAGWKGIQESDMILMPDADHRRARPVLRRADAATCAATSSSRRRCRATSATRVRSRSAPRPT